MTKMLATAKMVLHDGGYTCVLVTENTTLTSELRGVKPLLSWLQSAVNAAGGAAADKVVGKATACLYILLGVKAVYACVISTPALCMLSSYGVRVEYEVLTEHIINRRGDGICPFEEAVLGCRDPQTAYAAILKKAASLT